MRNPFKYGCVVSGENFCPRTVQEKQLRRFAESGQNVVIQGSRRMGKSSLVRKAFAGMRGWHAIFVDLYYIGTIGDLCRRVMDGVAKSNDSLPFLKKAMGMVSRIRPTLSFDPVTGSPVISIDAHAANEPDSLSAVMTMLEKIAAEGRVSIVFDEFQDILRLENAWKVLAEMRSAIQLQQDTPYFFLGSVRNEMMSIFSDSKSPFFKSAAAFEVERIDQDEFTEFIIGRFDKGDRRIDRDLVGKLMKRADYVSGDVQELCAAIWETTADGAVIREADISNALERVFSNEIKGFEKSISRLTPVQFAVLRGIARMPGTGVYSGEFLQSSGVASTGTVTKAVRRLVEDDLLYDVGRGMKFVDPFFREWILSRWSFS